MNLVNGKIYIGKHSTKDINDRYMSSSKLIKSAMKKYGKHNFTKEVLFICDSSDEAYEKEKELVNEDFIKRKDVYNVRVGGDAGPDQTGWKHTDEAKQKISKASKGIKKTEEHKKNYSAAAKKRDPEKQREMVDKMNSKGKTQEQIQKQKESMLGRIWMNFNDTSALVKSNDVDIYLENGWVKGRTPFLKRITNE
jgi:group I intron endonuclease